MISHVPCLISYKKISRYLNDCALNSKTLVDAENHISGEKLRSLLKQYNKRLYINDDGSVIAPCGLLLKSIEFMPSLDIASLKKVVNDKLPFSINFKGKVLITFGVFREGISFRWIYEKTVESLKDFTTFTSEVNLSEFPDGKLEFQLHFLADTEFTIDYYHPSISQTNTIDPAIILQRMTSPTLELCSELGIFYKFSDESKGFVLGLK